MLPPKAAKSLQPTHTRRLACSSIRQAGHSVFLHVATRTKEKAARQKRRVAMRLTSLTKAEVVQLRLTMTLPCALRVSHLSIKPATAGSVGNLPSVLSKAGSISGAQLGWLRNRRRVFWCCCRLCCGDEQEARPSCSGTRPLEEALGKKKAKARTVCFRMGFFWPE